MKQIVSKSPSPIHAKKVASLLSCLLLYGTYAGPVQASFNDTLDHKAVVANNVHASPMQATSNAGKRLVTVGARGLIAVSDDQGKTWSQSVSPVQSDLVAVHFPTAQSGWAVGHDGVVLHSKDAGKTWEKQLDGRIAKDAFVQYYKASPDANKPAYKAALSAVERNYKTGPSLPLLDVWFEDEKTGFAVGAFGLIIATTDGGRSWTPWLEKIDNPDLLNLNAVKGGNGDLYIAAERGAVFRLNREKRYWEAVPTTYTGSFFGLVVSTKAVLAYGLRGAVYRTVDKGKNWEEVAVPTQTTISSGIELKETGRFLLVNVGGEILISNASGVGFSTLKVNKGHRYTGVAQLPDDKLLLTSLEGLKVEGLNIDPLK